MKKFLSEGGLDKRLACDSAGVSGYHVGELPDLRMREEAAKRNFTLDSRARKFVEKDFQDFDYIIAMDRENLAHIKSVASVALLEKKVFMMTDFCRRCQEKEVPDPYYGSHGAFQRVLDILEDGVGGLIEFIKRDNGWPLEKSSS